MKAKAAFYSGILLALLAASAFAGSPIEAVPCSIIGGLWDALRAIGPSLIVIMLVYGAAKYIYSSEDPAGMKQGRDIFIHAIIGGIIMGLLAAIISAVGDVELCPMITGLST
ncbi:MAG: hypothetical protein V1744_00530 [Candidatus Altiarchaeota archaeon]